MNSFCVTVLRQARGRSTPAANQRSRVYMPFFVRAEVSKSPRSAHRHAYRLGHAAAVNEHNSSDGASCGSISVRAKYEPWQRGEGDQHRQSLEEQPFRGSGEPADLAGQPRRAALCGVGHADPAQHQDTALIASGGNPLVVRHWPAPVTNRASVWSVCSSRSRSAAAPRTNAAVDRASVAAGVDQMIGLAYGRVLATAVSRPPVHAPGGEAGGDRACPTRHGRPRRLLRWARTLPPALMTAPGCRPVRGRRDQRTGPWRPCRGRAASAGPGSPSVRPERGGCPGMWGGQRRPDVVQRRAAQRRPASLDGQAIDLLGKCPNRTIVVCRRRTGARVIAAPPVDQPPDCRPAYDHNGCAPGSICPSHDGQMPSSAVGLRPNQHTQPRTLVRPAQPWHLARRRWKPTIWRANRNPRHGGAPDPTAAGHAAPCPLMHACVTYLLRPVGHQPRRPPVQQPHTPPGPAPSRMLRATQLNSAPGRTRRRQDNAAWRAHRPWGRVTVPAC